MAKKKTKTPKRQLETNQAPSERALRELTNMVHKDLKTACIIRGLPFDDVVNLGHTALVEWFVNNYENSQDMKLLTQFDIWQKEKLKERGYQDGDALLHPALDLGHVGKVDELQKPQSIPKLAANKTAVKKQKSEVDESTGVRSGTKKSLTYKLALAKVPIGDIIKQVMQQFPEAQEKSIKIWAKRAIKEKDDK